MCGCRWGCECGCQCGWGVYGRVDLRRDVMQVLELLHVFVLGAGPRQLIWLTGGTTRPALAARLASDLCRGEVEFSQVQGQSESGSGSGSG